MAGSYSIFAYTADQFRTLITDVIQSAQRKGATEVEAEVSEGLGLSVAVRKGELETLEHQHDKGLGITVYVGKQRGHSGTSDFTPKALEAAIDAALQIAQYTQADEAAGLPEAHLMAKNYPDLDLFFPWNVSTPDALNIALECEAAAFAVDKRVTNSEGTSVSAYQSHFIYGNSLGFLAGYPSSRHSIGCAAIAEENDEMQRDDWYSMMRDAKGLESAQSVGAKAAQRAIARLGSRSLDTMQVPVLFESSLATSLIGHLVSAASGGSLYRKASFLVDQLHQQIFSDIVNIDEDPFIKRGIGSAAFDDEGIATVARPIISNGVLNSYFLSTYSARKLNMQSTGHAGGHHNLLVKPTAGDFQGLIKQMHRGVIVTELLGQGVNMLTGDYSRGAAGFWVEHGEIQHAVEGITIAGNLKDMFKQIVAIGSDVDARGSRQTGSILVEGMTVAGSS